jgi:hypothetical protein
MKKDTYLYLCQESEAGRDAFVLHPDTNEEGRVTSCVLNTDHVIVSAPDGSNHCWDFHECEEMPRMHEQWPRR